MTGRSSREQGIDRYVKTYGTTILWQRIRDKAGAYKLGREEIADILELIADEIEYRGTIDYDRDPGETADWLRAEAGATRIDIDL